MRIRVLLHCVSAKSLTINYNYPLSAAIYNLLRLGSPEFSEFLHSKGYKINARNYKLFSFALRFHKSEISNGLINLIEPGATLYIASPLIEDFVKNFLIGTFEQKLIELRFPSLTTIFNIKSAEIIPSPEFNSSMKFILLSPMVLSTGKIENLKITQKYLRPQNISTINRVLTDNLKNKYYLVYNEKKSFDEVSLLWDDDYLLKRERVTKKVTIKRNGIPPIDVIGIQAPFKLEANPDLIKVGYECGFGEKNSMGFGMAEVINN